MSKLINVTNAHLKSVASIKIELDYSKIDDIEIDGIDTRDYPDFCDAHISSATYYGREMTQVELDVLNDDSSFVYDEVQKALY